MSTEVDERVVQMRFDNREFESNASASMATLDKLRGSLNMSDAVRSFDDIDAAADKCDVSSLTSALQTVHSKFSAFEVMAITALSNITNAAVNAGKNFISSFTVEPIKAGFQEYETQMNSVQTILANTASRQKDISKEAIAGINANAESSVKSMSVSNEQALANLKRSQSNQLNEYEKTASKELQVLKDKSKDEEDLLKDSLDAENENLKKAHQAKLDLYQEEYMEKLKAIDEEKYNQLKAIDEEIGSINNLTKAEEEAIQKKKEAEQITELQNAVNAATSIDERTKAEERLIAYKAQLEREQLIKSREDKIKALEENKSGIENEAELEKTKAKETYDANKKTEDQTYATTSERLKAEQEEIKKAWSEQHAYEINLLKETQDTKKQALKDSQDSAMAAMKSQHESAMANISVEKDAQIKALSAVKEFTKGSNLEDVNKALDELNTYADKTIYNFTEMTRNIGTFTAAGIDLDSSVQSIKGIANLAAVSGSNSQQASSAMYQLSQAMASGTVKLQDWNSVVNSGMGGQVFQDALKETARVHGTAIDNIIAEEGSFRESLETGWLTSDILTETLSKFTGDLNTEQLKTMGYTDEQITSIIEMGQRANDAATKVKTFTQLFDTLKEAAQSGWTKSWQIIIGDFEEAKELLTNVSNVFGGIIGNASDVRNEMLQTWKDLGGRADLIDGLKNTFDGIMVAVTAVSDAFKEIFPPITGQQLAAFTEGFKNLSEKFKMNDETASKVKSTFKGLFAIVDIGIQAVSAVINAIKPLMGYLFQASGGVLNVTGSIGDFLVGIDESIKKTDFFNNAIKKIGDVLKPVADKIKVAVDFIKDSFLSIGSIDLSGVDSVSSRIDISLSPLTTIGNGLKIVFSKLGEIIKKLAPIFYKISEVGKEVFGELTSKFQGSLDNFNLDSLLDIINGGLFATLLIQLKKFVSGGSGILESVTGILDGVKGSLEAYQSQLKAGTLIKIATAIALLTASVYVLSTIDSDKLTESLTAMAIMFGELCASMSIFMKIVGEKDIRMMTKLGITMMALSVSILILAIAMKKISELSWEEIEKGTIGIAALMAVLVVAAKELAKVEGSVAKSAVGLLLMAVTINILVSAVEKLGALDTASLTKGLIGVGVLLAELVLFMKTADIDKMGVSKGIGIMALATAILILSEAVKQFASLDTESLIKGLAGVGVVLAELAIFLKVSGDAKKVTSTAIGLVILGAAMLIFAEAVEKMGNLSWEQIVKGLSSMAGVLTLVVASMQLMPKNIAGKAVGLLLIAAAIVVLSEALKTMGGMSWEEITKGLVALAGALTIITVAISLMKGALAGAAALFVVAAGLSLLAPVLKSLGGMSWTEIVKGLVALAGAFTIIGIAGAVLGPMTPALLALGASIALIGVGLLAAGAGLLLFSAGLAALAISGTAGAAALVLVVTSIVGLIPMVLEEIANGIVAFAVVIGESAPVLAAAIATLIVALSEAIIVALPPLMDCLGVVLVEVLDFLVKYIPIITDAGMKMIVGFLKGIADNIYDVVTVAADICINFINGIADKLPDIIQCAFNLVISFIEGLASAIENNTPRLIEASNTLFDALVGAAILVLENAVSFFKDIGNKIMESGFVQGIKDKIETAIETIKSIPDKCVEKIKETVSAFKTVGKYIIDGLIEGITSSITGIKDAAKNLATGALDAIKDILGIHSPSRAFAEIGMYMDKGLVKGLNSYSGDVSDSANNVGSAALDSLKGAMKNVSESLDGNLDSNPVICPVVDLTNIKQGGKQIDSIFEKRTGLTVGANIQNVNDANLRTKSVSSESSMASSQSQAATSMFIQNNYSPKALTPYEVERSAKAGFQLAAAGMR